jgi:hypothetical protein
MQTRGGCDVEEPCSSVCSKVCLGSMFSGKGFRQRLAADTIKPHMVVAIMPCLCAFRNLPRPRTPQYDGSRKYQGRCRTPLSLASTLSRYTASTPYTSHCRVARV